MIPSGRLNGYSVNTLKDVLVSSADADSTHQSVARFFTYFCYPVQRSSSFNFDPFQDPCTDVLYVH